MGTVDFPNLQQLRIFVAVARLESFSKAAAELHRSQPGITQALAKLESALGVPLMERRHSGSYPTACGRILHLRTQRLFTQIEQALTEPLIGPPFADRSRLGTILCKVTSNHMRCLVALADGSSIESAARDVGISTPSLSRIIRELQRIIGRRLTRHTAHGVSLTHQAAELARRLDSRRQGDRVCAGGDCRGTRCGPHTYPDRRHAPMRDGRSGLLDQRVPVPRARGSGQGGTEAIRLPACRSPHGSDRLSIRRATQTGLGEGCPRRGVVHESLFDHGTQASSFDAAAISQPRTSRRLRLDSAASWHPSPDRIRAPVQGSAAKTHLHHRDQCDRHSGRHGGSQRPDHDDPGARDQARGRGRCRRGAGLRAADRAGIRRRRDPCRVAPHSRKAVVPRDLARAGAAGLRVREVLDGARAATRSVRCSGDKAAAAP